MGRGVGTAPLVTSSLDGVLTFMPWPLYVGKKFHYPLNKSGWASELVWKLWRREKSLPLSEMDKRFFSNPVCSLVFTLAIGF